MARTPFPGRGRRVRGETALTHPRIVESGSAQRQEFAQRRIGVDPAPLAIRELLAQIAADQAQTGR